MGRIFLVIFLAAMLLFQGGFSALAQDGKLKVLVEALGDQSDQVKKYVTLALGLIEDVEVVDEDPNIYVHIITRKLVTNKGNRLGYVMTSASSEIIEMKFQGGRPFVVSDYSGLWLEVGPDLYKLSEQCVAAINGSVFERIREFEKE